MRNRVRSAALMTIIAGLALGLALPARAQDAPIVIVELGLEGVVDPFSANYVAGGIESAEDAGAHAVLLTIDTPGGLDSSMREITQAILNATVPVICYVAPEGARAASAGAFILMSCPVAAMAPATNVGAAHPVGVSGAIESQKAENDAAEYIVGLAERRGRNAEWAEQAVRDSISTSATDALELDVIDLVAMDTNALLEEIDGRTVGVGGGRSVVLRTADALLEERSMGWIANILHALLDPNIAFILFYLGLMALYFELSSPGLSIPGIVGVVLLVASFMAFGMLPVQLAGIVLLIASAVFFVWELFSPGIGIPAAGGVVCLVLGGLFLFDTSVPDVQVSLWVIAPVAVAAALFFGFVIRSVVRVHRGIPASSLQRLVGVEGTVLRPIDPRGVVLVASEEWTAQSVSGPMPKGTRIRVVAIEGLHLSVEPADEHARARPGTSEGSAE